MEVGLSWLCFPIMEKKETLRLFARHSGQCSQWNSCYGFSLYQRWIPLHSNNSLGILLPLSNPTCTADPGTLVGSSEVQIRDTLFSIDLPLSSVRDNILQSCHFSGGCLARPVIKKYLDPRRVGLTLKKENYFLLHNETYFSVHTVYIWGQT